MKRWIASNLIIILLLINIIPIRVFARESETSSNLPEEYFELLQSNYCNFLDGDTWNQHFLQNKDVSYIHVAKQMQNSDNYNYALKIASNIIKDVGLLKVLREDYSTDDVIIDYYQMALASLLVTMEENLATAIKNQTKVDLSINGADYILEGISTTLDVSSSLLGIEASVLDSIENQWAQACNIFSMDSEYMNILIEKTMDSLDSTDELIGRLYESNKYIMFNEFLYILRTNTDNELLA